MQEQEIINSSNSKKIIDSSGKEIGKILVYIFKLIGLTKNNIPDKEAALIIISRIKKKYGIYSISDLKLAFEMLSDGELKDTKRFVNGALVDLEHYQNFNWVYVRIVMDAFLKVRGSAIIKNRKVTAPNRILQTPKKDKATEEKESYEWLHNWINKNKKLPVGANWLNAYNHAVNNKIIIFKKGEKKEWASKVRRDISKEKNTQNKLFLKSIESVLSKEESFECECKIRFIKEHYIKLFNLAPLNLF